MRKNLSAILKIWLAVFILFIGACGGGGGTGASGSSGTSAQQSPVINDVPVLVSTICGVAAGCADGTGAAARFNFPMSVTGDDSSIYVADSLNHTIRKIVISTGAVTTLAGKSGEIGSADGMGIAARFNNPRAIVTDGTNLFVTDTGNHTIRKIAIGSGEVSTLAGMAGVNGSADGAGLQARFHYPAGITGDGIFLYIADTGNHTIRKLILATGEVTALAGKSGIMGSNNGIGIDAEFKYPEGITIDATSLYVTDTGNNIIRKIDLSTAEVTTLAGTAGSSGCSDGTSAAARFSSPRGIVHDGACLYVADTDYSIIRKVTMITGEVSTFAGTAGLYGSSDGVGAAARFYFPRGICTDGNRLYVADTENSTIRNISLQTANVATLAGTAGAPGFSDGTGTAARFRYPESIVSDQAHLYVADSGNHTVRKIVKATGEVTTIAGKAGEPGFADGNGVASRFSFPRGIASDGTCLYVADSGNHIIRKIVLATEEVTAYAGQTGVKGSTDGLGPGASFNNPWGITADETHLYVTDRDNSTIRKIDIETGEVTTLAGTPGSSGSSDGPGTAARFFRPAGITNDRASLYVSDTGNHTIRKIAKNTAIVSTLAGTAGQPCFTDGAKAYFFNPHGLTVRGNRIYLSDTYNSTIRAIEISSGFVTTLAGRPGPVGSTDGDGPAARFHLPQSIATDGTYLYITDTSNNTIRKIEFLD